jgi:light-regulated signal transduction histidine kinase (bacteriophytochrome)
LLNISLDIADIKDAERKIKELNSTLERKVSDRTQQLELLNKELEAFSYSVSHDLRAPLRIINGYADILVNDYKEVIGEDGKAMLNRIMSNTQRMGHLIDDLLNLSRLGRKEMRISSVDMDKLVHRVIEDQCFTIAKKPVFRVSSLPVVACDGNLIEQVWQNLVSNAIKYSSQTAHPEIEISYYYQNGFVVFEIKDNGVGFDMAFSDKLFGVFQRLHKRTEFEGTGIGLALVKRIVSRHNGVIWAQSAVGSGAKFSFNLPLNVIYEHQPG